MKSRLDGPGLHQSFPAHRGHPRRYGPRCSPAKPFCAETPAWGYWRRPRIRDLHLESRPVRDHCKTRAFGCRPCHLPSTSGERPAMT